MWDHIQQKVKTKLYSLELFFFWMYLVSFKSLQKSHNGNISAFLMYMYTKIRGGFKLNILPRNFTPYSTITQSLYTAMTWHVTINKWIRKQRYKNHVMLVTIWGRNATQSTFNNLTTAGQVKLVCITQTTFKICISQRLIHCKSLVMAASLHACKRCAAEVILVDWCTLWNILGTLLYMGKKKGKERNLWHAALFALWQWLASVPQYLLSDLLLSSRREKKRKKNPLVWSWRKSHFRALHTFTFTQVPTLHKTSLFWWVTIKTGFLH